MRTSTKIQRETMPTGPAWKSTPNRLTLATFLLLASGCAGTNGEPVDAGAEASSADAQSPADAEVGDGLDAHAVDASDADIACSFEDGGCSEGCTACSGYRYDIERGCRYEREVLTCYVMGGWTPPASPVDLTDPDGNCWILVNPPPEYYGTHAEGWTSGLPGCSLGLAPDVPLCDDA